MWPEKVRSNCVLRLASPEATAFSALCFTVAAGNSVDRFFVTDFWRSETGAGSLLSWMTDFCF